MDRNSPVVVASTSGGVTPRRPGFAVRRRIGLGRRTKGQITDFVVVSSIDDDGDKKSGKKTKQKDKKDKVSNRKRKKVEERNIPRMDREEMEVEAALSDTIGPADMTFMAASALGAVGIEWIGELETLRLKSLNLN